MPPESLEITINKDGTTSARLLGFDLPAVMGLCPGAGLVPSHGLQGHAAFVDRVSKILPQSWASSVVDIDSDEIDPMVVTGGALMEVLFSVPFLPLAWSQNLATVELTGLGPDRVLQSRDLLQQFAELNGQFQTSVLAL